MRSEGELLVKYYCGLLISYAVSSDFLFLVYFPLLNTNLSYAMPLYVVLSSLAFQASEIFQRDIVWNL
jgi:hypothetical protein